MPRTTTRTPVRQKRSLRCIRCAERKFRTPRDLALHILQKHGRIQLPTPPSDDTRSVTLNSPLLTEVEELDQLLAAAENSISKSKDDRRRGIRKRRRNLTTFSDSSQPGCPMDSENTTNTTEKMPVEGESIGPKSHDVYIARCRSGRIPLVPLPPQPVTMINFANGLF